MLSSGHRHPHRESNRRDRHDHNRAYDHSEDPSHEHNDMGTEDRPSSAPSPASSCSSSSSLVLLSLAASGVVAERTQREGSATPTVAETADETPKTSKRANAGERQRQRQRQRPSSSSSPPPLLPLALQQQQQRQPDTVSSPSGCLSQSQRQHPFHQLIRDQLALLQKQHTAKTSPVPEPPSSSSLSSASDHVRTALDDSHIPQPTQPLQQTHFPLSVNASLPSTPQPPSQPQRILSYSAVVASSLSSQSPPLTTTAQAPVAVSVIVSQAEDETSATSSSKPDQKQSHTNQQPRSKPHSRSASSSSSISSLQNTNHTHPGTISSGNTGPDAISTAPFSNTSTAISWAAAASAVHKTNAARSRRQSSSSVASSTDTATSAHHIAVVAFNAWSAGPPAGIAFAAKTREDVINSSSSGSVGVRSEMLDVVEVFATPPLTPEGAGESLETASMHSNTSCFRSLRGTGGREHRRSQSHNSARGTLRKRAAAVGPVVGRDAPNADEGEGDEGVSRNEPGADVCSASNITHTMATAAAANGVRRRAYVEKALEGARPATPHRAQSHGQFGNRSTGTTSSSLFALHSRQHSGSNAGPARSSPRDVSLKVKPTGFLRFSEEFVAGLNLEPDLSLMPGMFQLPPEIEMQLNAEIEKLCKNLLPTDADVSRRKDFVTKIQRLVNAEWPDKQIHVHAFGSTVNGLGSQSSDVDLCMTTPWKDPLKGISNMFVLATFFRKHGMTKIYTVSKAKVPICKFYDPEYDVSCDINVNNVLALRNTELMKAYVDMDPRVRPFITIVKYWAKQRALNDAAKGGTLSSYCWVVMAINFLQTRSPPILPSLQQIYLDKLAASRASVPMSSPALSPANSDTTDEPLITASADPLIPPPPQTIIEGVDCSFESDPTTLQTLRIQSAQNTQSLASLVTAFFRFFGHEFAYDSLVMSVRHGTLLPKARKGWDADVERMCRFLCVEEPLTPDRNLANSADDLAVRGLRGEFRRALRLCLGAEGERAVDDLLGRVCDVVVVPPLPPSMASPHRGGSGGYWKESGSGTRSPNNGRMRGKFARQDSVYSNGSGGDPGSAVGNGAGQFPGSYPTPAMPPTGWPMMTAGVLQPITLPIMTSGPIAESGQPIQQHLEYVTGYVSVPSSPNGYYPGPQPTNGHPSPHQPPIFFPDSSEYAQSRVASPMPPSSSLVGDHVAARRPPAAAAGEGGEAAMEASAAESAGMATLDATSNAPLGLPPASALPPRIVTNGEKASPPPTGLSNRMPNGSPNEVPNGMLNGMPNGMPNGMFFSAPPNVNYNNQNWVMNGQWVTSPAMAPAYMQMMPGYSRMGMRPTQPPVTPLAGEDISVDSGDSKVSDSASMQSQSTSSTSAASSGMSGIPYSAMPMQFASGAGYHALAFWPAGPAGFIPHGGWGLGGAPPKIYTPSGGISLQSTPSGLGDYFHPVGGAASVYAAYPRQQHSPSGSGTATAGPSGTEPRRSSTGLSSMGPTKLRSGGDGYANAGWTPHLPLPHAQIPQQRGLGGKSTGNGMPSPNGGDGASARLPIGKGDGKFPVVGDLRILGENRGETKRDPAKREQRRRPSKADPTKGKGTDSAGGETVNSAPKTDSLKKKAASLASAPSRALVTTSDNLLPRPARPQL